MNVYIAHKKKSCEETTIRNQDLQDEIKTNMA